MPNKINEVPFKNNNKYFNKNYYIGFIAFFHKMLSIKIVKIKEIIYYRFQIFFFENSNNKVFSNI